MSQVITKFPTSTTVIVSGWNNPTNAYAEDGVNADSSTNGAEQKYGGWNFTTADIPPGSTITAVKFGAKHYEVDPSGYTQYTTLKYVNSAGTAYTLDLTKRTSLTWDWFDITAKESSWDLTKLNNADCRIICKLVATSSECYGEDSFFLKQRDDGLLEFVNVADVKVGDKLHVSYKDAPWSFGFEEVSEIVCEEGVNEFITIWLEPVEVPSQTKPGKTFFFHTHATFTALHPHWAWKKVGENYVVFKEYNMKEIWRRVMDGEEFYLPCFYPKVGSVIWLKILRCDLHMRRGRWFKILFKNQAKIRCISVEGFADEDFKMLEAHGYKRKAFNIEETIPLPGVITKGTAYVDAVALQVTFTPPVTAVPRNIGDSLASTVVNV
jgi:hypothetical protein